MIPQESTHGLHSDQLSMNQQLSIQSDLIEKETNMSTITSPTFVIRQVNHSMIITTHLLSNMSQIPQILTRFNVSNHHLQTVNTHLSIGILSHEKLYALSVTQGCLIQR